MARAVSRRRELGPVAEPLCGVVAIKGHGWPFGARSVPARAGGLALVARLVHRHARLGRVARRGRVGPALERKLGQAGAPGRRGVANLLHHQPVLGKCPPPRRQRDAPLLEALHKRHPLLPIQQHPRRPLAGRPAFEAPVAGVALGGIVGGADGVARRRKRQIGTNPVPQMRLRLLALDGAAEIPVAQPLCGAITVKGQRRALRGRRAHPGTRLFAGEPQLLAVASASKGRVGGHVGRRSIPGGGGLQVAPVVHGRRLLALPRALEAVLHKDGARTESLRGVAAGSGGERTEGQQQGGAQVQKPVPERIRIERSLADL